MECEYRTINKKYMCLVKVASITEKNAKLEAKDFKGVHQGGKGNRSVGAIWFRHTTVKYFPRNLQKIFPNLNEVAINFCGLQEISREDFIGLENLATLDLNDNLIKVLPDDLFVDSLKLTSISLNHNLIKFATSKLLEVFDGKCKFPLTLFDMDGNSSINAYYTTCNTPFAVSKIQQLKEIIDQKCKPPCESKEEVATHATQPNQASQAAQASQASQAAQASQAIQATYSSQACQTDENAEEVLLLQGFNNLRKSSHLTDFAIVVGSREFPVHKNVLAVQSPIFAKMFETPAIEDKLNICDFKTGTVEAFLQYLYERKRPEFKHTIEVFKLAAKYDVTKLTDICEQTIRVNLEKTDAMKILEFAREFNLEELKRLAFNRIQEVVGRSLSDDLMENSKELNQIVKVKRYLDDLLNRNKRIKLEKVDDEVIEID